MPHPDLPITMPSCQVDGRDCPLRASCILLAAGKPAPQVDLHLDEGEFDFYISACQGAHAHEVAMAEEVAEVLGYVALEEEEQEYNIEDDGTVRIYLVPREAVDL